MVSVRSHRRDDAMGAILAAEEGTLVQLIAQSARINNHANLIWALADLLRGDYRPSEYQKVILPLVVLRRLDCVLEPTKQRVLERLRSATVTNVGPLMQAITGIEVYNTSRLTLKTILADPAQVAGNLRAWIAAFDPETRDVIEKFDFGWPPRGTAVPGEPGAGRRLASRP